jgi:hypothetical protein
MSATRLPELRRALVAAAAELEAAEGTAGAPAAPPVAPRPRVRRPRGRGRRLPAARVVVLALLALLALAALGAAATGLLGSGSDVRPRSGKPPRPKVGFGVPVGAVAAPLRVADPSGDRLDWGLRTFHTTRGFACLQIGRMQGDQFGVVGRDGAFDDDGLFHALGPQVLDQAACIPRDERGHGFLAIRNAELPGSALSGSCLPPSMVRAFGGRVPPSMTPCREAAVRTVDYGLLGPHARTITYKSPSGAPRTIPVARGTGAYLIVSPPQATVRMSGPSGHGGRMTGGDEYLLSQTPESRTILSVAYDDGTVCRVRHQIGSAGGCPAKGFVALVVRQPTRAEVATPVRARIERNAEGSFTLHVAFRARVAARQARAAYWVEIRPPGGRCHWGIQGHAVDRDVAAGQRVGAAIKLDRRICRGTYRIELGYRIAQRRSVFGAGLHYPGTPVGTATARLVK